MRHRPYRFGAGNSFALLAFACLILLATAVPVVAAPAESESSRGWEPPMQASEYPDPSPASIQDAYRVFQREEHEREVELGKEPFIAQREASRMAYAEDTPAEAEELLLSTFGGTLAKLNREPARSLSDSKLDENLGNGSAVVTYQGNTQILEANQPIEVENSEGEMKKVDVSLERNQKGFEPENPMVEVEIGATADGGVEVGEEGLTITQAGAEDTRGRLLGDKNVFFGEVEEGSDTDLMVSPTSHGVELFDMLRSAGSPDTLRFHVEVPEGDSLHLLPESGVEVVDPEGSVVSMVSKPSAEDAEGTSVPVELGLDGDDVVLHLNHRQEDLAYPILVDPAVIQDWEEWYANRRTQGLQYWNFVPHGEAANHPTKGLLSSGIWAGNYGLFESIQNGWMSEGTQGEWVLNSPNLGVRIVNAGIFPFYMNKQGCEASEPYDFAGLYDVQQHQWNMLKFSEAERYGSATLNSWGHQMLFGLGVNVNWETECWRDLMAAGISFSMEDWGPPTMLSATASAPSGWFNGSTGVSVNVHAVDGGLGISEFSFAPSVTNPGNNVPKSTNCAGTYESPCPLEVNQPFSFAAAEFPQGEDNLTITADSPTLERSNGVPVTFKVDREPPVVNLEGQLITAVKEGEAHLGEKQGEGGPELNQAIYNLKVKAEDGVEGTRNVSAMRSGVKTVEVIVTNEDGKVESSKAFPNPKAPCAEGSCAESLTYPIAMTGLTAGKHHLIVKASDFAGNAPTEIHREFEYFPATGLTEEDVTQRFLLPDGKEHAEGSYQGPELAVNVMNGNVVYHQRDVEAEGSNANLEVELFYNSMLPKEKSSEFGTGWTLSQTPSLDPGPSGNMATAVTSESQLTGNVALPQVAGEGHYSDKLGAYIEKEPGGGFSVGEGGESPATVFNSEGQATEVQTTPTAAVQYQYSGEQLSEIAVDDPGSTDLPPSP